jgi:hypothetical protein
MILRFYPTKDATLYESAPERNTGIDQILELQVLAATASVGAAATASYVSRIVLDFDYAAISSSIVALGYDPNNFNYGLKLYTTEPEQIPLNYTIEAYPLAYSWNMGLGRANTTPATTEGVSWYYREGKNTPATSWPTESFIAGTTGSWQVLDGGGVWYTASEASQSFSYTTTDVDVDITSIIHQVQSGSITFNGLIIKRSSADENTLSTSRSSLKFYSKDTNTIYSPVIEARYDDSVHTGTPTVIDTDEEYNLIASNLRSTYKEDSRPRLNINPRYRYPVMTFSTSSVYLNSYSLPTGSQYAVYLAKSDDAIVNFSEYTKISSDNNGSFIRLNLSSFQPEQYYRLLLKVPQSDGVSYDIYDDNFVFKVERNQ